MDTRARTILTLMVFAAGFSIVRVEINPSGGATGVVPPAKVLLGTAIATPALILLSHAGDTGSEIATGLAFLTFFTAVLVNGGPVWSVVSRLTGSTAPTPTPTTNKGTK